MVCESWVLPQPAPMSVKSQPQTDESVLTELPIDLADAAGLKPLVEDRIPLSAASGDAETALSDMCEVATGHESGTIGQALLHRLLDFLDLDLGEAANLEQVLAVLGVNGLVINPLAIAHWLAEAGY